MGAAGTAGTAGTAGAKPGARPVVCVLCGSPRRGRCLELAGCVARGVERAGCEARTLALAGLEVAGCTGCGACSRTGECALPADAAAEVARALEAADALALVAPVFFAGPPSQLKAVLDRLQPLWARRYLLGTSPLLPKGARKPFDLVVVGTGGDPFGYEPLVTCCRSALRMADYELREVRDLVGADALADTAAASRSAQVWGEDLARRLLDRPARP